MGLLHMLRHHIFIIQHHFTNLTLHTSLLIMDLFYMKPHRILVSKVIPADITDRVLFPFQVHLSIMLIKSSDSFAHFLAFCAFDLFLYLDSLRLLGGQSKINI